MADKSLPPHPLFRDLLIQAEDCGKDIGIDKDFITNLYYQDSDWAFIIKIDAIHETALKDFLIKGMRLSVANKEWDEECIEDFVNKLAFYGKGNSIIRILKHSGLHKSTMEYITNIREIRNDFAHDVRHVSKSLFEIISSKTNKSQIMKTLSTIHTDEYTESGFIELIEEYGGYVLRLSILRKSMTFLRMIHNTATANKNDPLTRTLP